MVINSAPIPLVKDGEILYKGLKKARISLDLLLGELRKEKVADVKSVALAFWEADGTISIFLDPKYQPITPSTMQIMTEPFDLARTIIKEGKINSNELLQIQKDEDWVISKLENFYHTDIKNVLLATVDKNENFKVFLYK
ncbi:uncharacterized membrane protein YcaP (DUF421 family) [Bacillus sp. SORGH_AS 510]|uniref:DUF421 domain-containing protein n=1 Tax=Bacillus sp. SORGH_AS_0510 TaxID=3041771 RepID=UPI00278274F7|nr:DUF421 domain-containing protein [Bacillus sp. SORGH_AS_0510]MDQ1145695.1 uncharacterized membrane protein YcaP (DUF421 family) [Bacillus sp. SORGH_AS_0510]